MIRVLWNGSKLAGEAGRSVRKMKMRTVALVGTGE